MSAACAWCGGEIRLTANSTRRGRRGARAFCRRGCRRTFEHIAREVGAAYLSGGSEAARVRAQELAAKYFRPTPAPSPARPPENCRANSNALPAPDLDTVF